MKDVYDAMNDPTVDSKLVEKVFVTVLRKWRDANDLTSESDYDDMPLIWKGKLYSDDDEQPKMSVFDVLLTPIRVRVFVDNVDDPSVFGFSSSEKLRHMALLQVRYPALMGFDLTVEMSVKIIPFISSVVPYNESLITLEYQKFVDEYEPVRNAKNFRQGFRDIFLKLTDDIIEWTEKYGREDVLRVLNDVVKDFCD